MDYKKIRLQAEEIITKIGRDLKEARKTFDKNSIEVKGQNDFVTQFDKQTEIKLVAALEKLLPDAGFIAEEQTSQKKSDVLNWIIDPIDGTTNFIHGLPAYAISVALIHNSELVVGVVYEVCGDECFAASKGEGAFLNGDPISVSKAEKVADSLVATGFPYNNYSRMEAFMESLRYFMEHSHGLRRIGTAATDLAYVACGRFEAFYEYDLKPWDVAAGALLVREAGGYVGDFLNGDDFLFGGEIVATNAATQEEFTGIVASYMNK